MREKDDAEKRGTVLEIARAFCFACYLFIPITLALLVSRYVVAEIFNIEGWGRTLPVYLYSFTIIFIILLAYFFGKYQVDEKISDLIMKYLSRWL
jgi:hypothetical protein